MKGFVILHPAAGTCKNAREKRERVGTERMRKKAVNRETGGFVNSAVNPQVQLLQDEYQHWIQKPGGGEET